MSSLIRHAVGALTLAIAAAAPAIAAAAAAAVPIVTAAKRWSGEEDK